MKKLVVIALALFTLNGMAQEKRERHSGQYNKMELRKDMTPKDIADLKAKKLTLKLDLTDAQQKKVHNILLTQAKANKDLRKEHNAERGEKREKPTKDEFVKIQNHRLDQQIKLKRKMKAILTPEQYAKFEKIKTRQHRKKGNHKKKQ